MGGKVYNYRQKYRSYTRKQHEGEEGQTNPSSNTSLKASNSRDNPKYRSKDSRYHSRKSSNERHRPSYRWDDQVSTSPQGSEQKVEIEPLSDDMLELLDDLHENLKTLETSLSNDRASIPTILLERIQAFEAENENHRTSQTTWKIYLTSLLNDEIDTSTCIHLFESV